MTTARTKYRAPVIRESVEVSLDDFSDEEIAEYLRNQGYRVDGDASEVGSTEDDLFIHRDDLNYLSTLALCGQQDAARAWIVERIGRYIGRPLQ